ncbi:TPA: PapB/FocB family fimbrial expression transcriptional regulator, partial [Salmonella enterica]
IKRSCIIFVTEKYSERIISWVLDSVRDVSDECRIIQEINVDKFTYLHDKKPGHLRPGEVHPEHFRMLIESSSIHSPKVIQVVEDFLVHGVPRKIACEKYGVSAGYVSVTLKRLQELSYNIVMMYPYYVQGGIKN